MARVIEKKPGKTKKNFKLKIKSEVALGIICGLLAIGLVFTILYKVGVFEEKVDRVPMKFNEYGLAINHDQIRFGEEHTDPEESFYLFEPGDFMLVFNSDYDVYDYENSLVMECINGTSGGFKLETELERLFTWLALEENAERSFYRIDTSRVANKDLNRTITLGNYSDTSSDDAVTLTITDTTYALVFYRPGSDGGYEVYDFSVSGTIGNFKTEILEMID